MQKIECAKCGCDRVIMLKSPKVRLQKAKDNMTEMEYRHLCVPCLLNILGASYDEVKKVPNIFTCMSDED